MLAPVCASSSALVAIPHPVLARPARCMTVGGGPSTCANSHGSWPLIPKPNPPPNAAINAGPTLSAPTACSPRSPASTPHGTAATTSGMADSPLPPSLPTPAYGAAPFPSRPLTGSLLGPQLDRTGIKGGMTRPRSPETERPFPPSRHRARNVLLCPQHLTASYTALILSNLAGIPRTC